MNTMKIYASILTLFILVACSTDKTKSQDEIKESETNLAVEPIEKNIEPVYPDFYFDTLVGSYEGMFGGSMIRINLNFASNKHITGYNIHKGLVRNLNGQISEDSNFIYLELAEPGDNKFDGIFNISVNREDLSMKGEWTPNDKRLKSRNFKLKRINNDFLENLDYVSDSLGIFTFDRDGFIKYEYYPIIDGSNHKDQMEIIQGNWTFTNDSTITVIWEKNGIFENTQSQFKIRETKYDNYSEPYLYINGRKLYSNIY